MAGDILGLGADALAGGVFGIVGTALGRVAGFFERKQEFKQEQARWGHEKDLHELNMQAKNQEAEIELAITAQKGSWSGLDASIQHDISYGQGSPWVVNTLRLVRPVLTLLLWLITAWVYKKSGNEGIIEAAVFAATAATLWWFGDRAPSNKRNWAKGAKNGV